LGIFQRLLARFRRKPDLFNLQIEPAYSVKASGRNPYFQALERVARQAGYLGNFIVDADGKLRPGTGEALETRHARLILDVYPNPAAIESRTVVNYDSPDGPRRIPPATLALDNDEELYLRPVSGGLRVEGPCLPQMLPN